MTTFTVKEEFGDDPETNQSWTQLTAQQVRTYWPPFASLFPDNSEARLVFEDELVRWTITPDCFAD